MTSSAAILACPRRSRPPPREDPSRVLARYWQDIHAARRALVRRCPSAIAHTARGLLSSLASVRVQVELAYASAAFADALDERPLAQEWVSFALTARATLDEAEKSGASVLTEELDELDEAFDDARDAVLLLEPEDYKDALAGTPPNTSAWWGERARLDSGLREISLERALGELADDR
jgi:hypothetical protein